MRERRLCLEYGMTGIRKMCFFDYKLVYKINYLYFCECKAMHCHGFRRALFPNENEF